MTPAPSRSLEQRRAALAKANRIRTARAELKRDLKAGRASFLDLVTDPPEWAATMKVYDALLATPKVGAVKANKVLAAARISPSKTLAGMTHRQRTELVRGLTGIGPVTARVIAATFTRIEGGLAAEETIAA